MKFPGNSWVATVTIKLPVCLGLFAGALRGASIREALAEFETGATSPTFCAGDHKIGRNKEVSRYQILPSVWSQYSPSREYWNPAVAWSVAERILSDRIITFRNATSRNCDHFDLYLLWNAPGAYAQTNYNRQKLSRTLLARAERFANLASVRTSTTTALAKAK